jgi:hypothetical protein
MRKPLVDEEERNAGATSATPRSPSWALRNVGGAKTIGYFSSIVLLINNITGPGVPSLPNMFVEAGWLVPLVCLVGTWLMTTLSAAMYCEAMERCAHASTPKDFGPN